jgi:hypothetical protein
MPTRPSSPRLNGRHCIYDRHLSAANPPTPTPYTAVRYVPPLIRHILPCRHFAAQRSPGKPGETQNPTPAVNPSPVRRCLPRDLSWPKNPDFYEQYRGQLSPVGCQMLIDVGHSFYRRYLLVRESPRASPSRVFY